MIYLDHAATTPMRPGVWESMAPFASDKFGNSSGVHEVSRRAKNALEEAREQIAGVIGAKPMEVVFTSGGTESDNLALKGVVLNRSPRKGVVTVATEHDAILESVSMIDRMGLPVSIVGVDRSGLVDEEEILDAMDHFTAVVSVMLLNNETGVVQDVRSIGKLLPEGVLLHTDAVQAFGSMDIDVDDLGVDLMTITGHKFGGPKGAGILYVREGTPLEPLIHGGGQELGRRSGTHDVAGAVGLATAMSLAASDRDRFRRDVGAIRDDFEKRLLAGVEGAVVNSPSATRSHHHLNIRFPGVRNETLLLRMDQEGVAASAGSACQSGAATVSHVLESMGLSPAEARESVRFSFGWSSTAAEAAEAAEIVIDLAGRLR
ncbi:MAG: cysteine desulfurase family protein [Acidimicrobiia bacterium]|nr:cysteine desulfurase family protein [Acidimicrobiia bacterium]